MSALLTWGSLLLEASIPALLISKRGRRLGFAGGLALHGGIAIASIAGMFSLCMIPFFAAFLKTEDFDLVQRLGVRIREMASRARTASFEKPLG
jgi:hypothetical protein